MTTSISEDPLSSLSTERKRSPLKRWIRAGFLIWAACFTLWQANSFRTQGVDDRVLRSNATISVKDNAETLEFSPIPASSHPSPVSPAALIFLCGSGVDAPAYAPLLRPLAENGHAVFVVKLPYRFALLESHKLTAIARVNRVIQEHPEIKKWVLAGHSLGGALACRAVKEEVASHRSPISALVLIGTTHPKDDDLSALTIPVTKVYASNDGVAPLKKVLANKVKLPATTRWIEIDGGNHSQFGYYGHQFLDGRATISRVAQQEITRSALADAFSKI